MSAVIDQPRGRCSGTGPSLTTTMSHTAGPGKHLWCTAGTRGLPCGALRRTSRSVGSATPHLAHSSPRSSVFVSASTRVRHQAGGQNCAVETRSPPRSATRNTRWRTAGAIAARARRDLATFGQGLETPAPWMFDQTFCGHSRQGQPNDIDEVVIRTGIRRCVRVRAIFPTASDDYSP